MPHTNWLLNGEIGQAVGEGLAESHPEVEGSLGQSRRASKSLNAFNKIINTLYIYIYISTVYKPD